MDTKTAVGTWTGFDFKISAEAEKVFKETLGKLIGVKYQLIAVATQLVSGTNFCFLCEATPATRSPVTSLVEGFVYQPLKGDPRITEILPVVECHRAPGAWEGFHKPTAEEMKLFDGAVKIVGSKFEPLAVTEKVVAGMQYCYLCKATPLAEPNQAVAHPALVYLSWPLCEPGPHLWTIKSLYPGKTAQMAD